MCAGFSRWLVIASPAKCEAKTNRISIGNAVIGCLEDIAILMCTSINHRVKCSAFQHKQFHVNYQQTKVRNHCDACRKCEKAHAWVGSQLCVSFSFEKTQLQLDLGGDARRRREDFSVETEKRERNSLEMNILTLAVWQYRGFCFCFTTSSCFLRVVNRRKRRRRKRSSWPHALITASRSYGRAGELLEVFLSKRVSRSAAFPSTWGTFSRFYFFLKPFCLRKMSCWARDFSFRLFFSSHRFIFKCEKFSCCRSTIGIFCFLFIYVEKDSTPRRPKLETKLKLSVRLRSSEGDTRNLTFRKPLMWVNSSDINRKCGMEPVEEAQVECARQEPRRTLNLIMLCLKTASRTPSFLVRDATHFWPEDWSSRSFAFHSVAFTVLVVKPNKAFEARAWTFLGSCGLMWKSCFS